MVMWKSEMLRIIVAADSIAMFAIFGVDNLKVRNWVSWDSNEE